jgi:hypothetical protein
MSAKRTSGLAAFRSTRSTQLTPAGLSLLAKAYTDLGQHHYAWRCVHEAMMVVESTGERWFEADVHRMVGEVALISPQSDLPKAETYFQPRP